MISKASITKPSRNIASITARIAPAVPPGRSVERAVHHVVAAEAAEHQAEQRGADQDDEDHAVICVVLLHHGLERGAPSRALERGEQDRADRADRSGFGRRRDAAQDRAEHGQDQQRAARPAPRSAGAPARKPFGAPGSGGIAGDVFGKKHRHGDQIKDVERHQREARHDGAGEQVATDTESGAKIALARAGRTDRRSLSWSPSSTSTVAGGKICASVAVAATVPAASRLS